MNVKDSLVVPETYTLVGGLGSNEETKRRERRGGDKEEEKREVKRTELQKVNKTKER